MSPGSPAAWPRSGRFALRYRVDDLLPSARGLAGLRAIFIGESPHRDEVAPETAEERSPFRGMAGREWWTELSRHTGRPEVMRPVPPRARLGELCDELGIAVMNAVQFPIDPKITLHQGEACEPFARLGFEKGQGPRGYRAVHKQGGARNPVAQAIEDLAGRLARLGRGPATVVCLGNDSRWFVERACERLAAPSPRLARPLLMIPHPSAWWRKAEYRARAVATLDDLLGSPVSFRNSDSAESRRGSPGRPA